jgi:hypothetical protein
LMASFEQVMRHGAAHNAKSDETKF